MPKRIYRQPTPAYSAEDERGITSFDGLLVNGVDKHAAHREQCRALIAADHAREDARQRWREERSVIGAAVRAAARRDMGEETI